jgi:hypothetical protein
MKQRMWSYTCSPVFSSQHSGPCQLHRNNPEILCWGIQVSGKKWKCFVCGRSLQNVFVDYTSGLLCLEEWHFCSSFLYVLIMKAKVWNWFKYGQVKEIYILSLLIQSCNLFQKLLKHVFPLNNSYRFILYPIVNRLGLVGCDTF